jgi:hypothetical protein
MTMSVKQGGAWNPVTGLYVKQSGAWQSVQTGYVKQSGVWNVFYSSGLYNGSMTAGYVTDGLNFTYVGYEPIYTIGSVSPGTLTDGKTLYSLYDYYDLNVGSSYGFFQVSGFSVDPGASYFTTLTVNSTNYSSASAFYSYSAGVATWVYSLFGFTNSTVYPVVIV